jgi:hypothetical protein
MEITKPLLPEPIEESKEVPDTEEVQSCFEVFCFMCWSCWDMCTGYEY